MNFYLSIDQAKARKTSRLKTDTPYDYGLGQSLDNIYTLTPSACPRYSKKGRLSNRTGCSLKKIEFLTKPERKGTKVE